MPRSKPKVTKEYRIIIGMQSVMSRLLMVFQPPMHFEGQGDIYCHGKRIPKSGISKFLTVLRGVPSVGLGGGGL